MNLPAQIYDIAKYRKSGTGTGEIESKQADLANGPVYQGASVQPRVLDASTLTGESAHPTIHFTVDRRERIDIEKLYPDKDILNAQLAAARSLLRDALHHAEDALATYQTSEFMQSDDAIQKIYALMPELFCCRTLGDGFGLLIKAVFHSIQNSNGKPFDETQIAALQRTLTRLYNEPYITFQVALQLELLLEGTGLLVDPATLPHFIEALGE